MKINKDVLVCGFPRSGSMLVYKTLCDLFNKKNLLHTHYYRIPYEKTIVTFRDFRDCLISLRRIDNRNNDDFDKESQPNLIETLKYVITIKKYLFHLRKTVKNKKDILFLRYENFVDDFDYLFDKIEGYLNVRIDSKKRNRLKRDFNKNKQKEISDKIRKDQFLFDSLMRNHIYKGEIDGWKRIIKKKYHFLVYLLLRRDLLNYNYSKHGK